MCFFCYRSLLSGTYLSRRGLVGKAQGVGDEEEASADPVEGERRPVALPKKVEEGLRCIVAFLSCPSLSFLLF